MCRKILIIVQVLNSAQFKIWFSIKLCSYVLLSCLLFKFTSKWDEKVTYSKNNKSHVLAMFPSDIAFIADRFSSDTSDHSFLSMKCCLFFSYLVTLYKRSYFIDDHMFPISESNISTPD